MRRPATFAALYLSAAALTLAWLRLNRAPPNWDDAWYLSNSLTLYDAWTSGGLPGLGRQFLAALEFKAPLITALPLPFYLIFGRRWHYAFLVNIASMLVLFAGVWGIGNRLRDSRSGLLAVYITATLPLLYGLSRWYLVEYPLAACVVLAWWLVLVSEDLMRPGVTVALGIVCGFGLLLKVDFPIFVAIPIGTALLRSRNWRSLLQISIPSLILAGPWYALHWRATLDNVISAGFGAPALIQGTGAIFSPGAMLAYVGLIAERGVSVYYLLVTAAAGLLVLLRRQFRILSQISQPAWWLAPFLIFLFGGNKDVRYIAPLLPAFALAAACLLDAALDRRKWLIPAVLAFPLLSLLAISFHWPYTAGDLGYVSIYDRNTWLHAEILRAITDSALVHPGQRKVILLGTGRALFNADNFQLTALQNRLPLDVRTTAYEKDWARLLDLARASSYFVYKQGGEPESAFFNIRSAELIEYLRSSPEWDEIPFGRVLPDGGTAHILRHGR
ncbi:MAG: glycosyltransferase family 39 protein [Acidobacteriota bacterium]|nr:glycosyltransferase family 39 protein [Acidobacteriota bacterium]